MNRDPSTNNEQVNDNYNAWAKMADEVTRDRSEIVTSASEITGCLSKQEQAFLENNPQMPIMLDDNGDKLLPAINQSQEFFVDNRDYIIQKATQVQLEGIDDPAILNGEFAVGDEAIVAAPKEPHDAREEAKFENRSAKVLSAEPGYRVSAIGQEDSEFHNEAYITQNFETNGDDTYRNKAIYKGIKNDTGVEILPNTGFIALNKYISDPNLSNENSKDQLLLAQYDPDTDELIAGSVEFASLKNGGFFRKTE